MLAMNTRVGLFVVVFLALGCDEAEPTSDASIDATLDSAADTLPDAPAEDTSTEDTSVEDSSSPDTAVADTWTNFAEGFMATYCVECHDGMTGAGRDYQLLANVVAEQTSIRCGTTDVTLDDCGPSPRARQFPIGSGPSPDDAERQRFIAWIDAGLAE